jgi:hypothetical protein
VEVINSDKHTSLLHQDTNQDAKSFIVQAQEITEANFFHLTIHRLAL